MVSSVKLPMLKKGEYTIWAIRMEEYLIHIDFEQWLVVLNGNSPVQYTKNEAGKDMEVLPITAKDIQARVRERKARSALLMALPDVDLPKYHLIKDAKGIWDAIKTRYGGNATSKKMQKSVLKQQFEAFSISNSEGLDKGFDRFQRLLTLLSIHEAELSTEDINSKFLRSLPSTWTNVSLIMRNKEGIDDMDIDDLYNTLKAHEGIVKRNTVDSDDFEEIDLKWQVAMISTRINKFYKRTGRKLQFDRKEPVGFDKTKLLETPKEVKLSAPLIQDWDTDSDNESIFRPKQVFEKVNFVKEGAICRPFQTHFNRTSRLKSVQIAKSVRPITPVKPIQQTEKPKESCSSPKVEKRDWNGRMAQNLGLAQRRSLSPKRVSTVRQAVNTGKGNGITVVKPSIALKDKGITDSGCSRHMTGTKEYLSDYQEIKGGFVAFSEGKGRITGKVTDDFSRFSWVFFMTTKDETSGILKKFITEIENQVNRKIKVIRCDNGTKFKNKEMNDFCANKGIRREFSNARTPQQNGVAERKNRTLIEAARTMLADSLLPVIFWAEAVNTACYVLNRVLVTKTQNT
ncbi:ribonuclease H-like domain-containing protein [Tanacetum coccineum]